MVSEFGTESRYFLLYFLLVCVSLWLRRMCRPWHSYESSKPLLNFNLYYWVLGLDGARDLLAFFKDLFDDRMGIIPEFQFRVRGMQ